MITVVCVLVRGYVNYTPEYVFKLRSMVLRLLPEPHEFVCLTDQSHSLPGVNCYQIPTPNGLFPWWAKIHLFSSKIFLAKQQLLYLDIDVLPVKLLSDLLNFQGFTIIPHAGNFRGGGSMKTVPLFNSSCMTWTAEECYHLYDNWSEDVTKRLWGDQDWIGEQIPKANTFPLEWFPRLSEVRAPPFPEEAKVILTKKPKNHIAAQRWPWFREMWR